MKVFTEGVFTAIMKMFSFSKIVDAIKQYEDVTNSDQFKTDLNDYNTAKKEYEQSLDDLCAEFPHNKLCKDYNKERGIDQ